MITGEKARIYPVSRGSCWHSFRKKVKIQSILKNTIQVSNQFIKKWSVYALVFKYFLILGPGQVVVGLNIIPICQGCRFDPRSGYMQESTNECINKWDNNLMFLSFLSSCSLKSIKINKKYFLILINIYIVFILSIS